MNSKRRFGFFAIFVIVSIFVALFSSYFGLNVSSLENFVSDNPLSSIIIYNLLFIGLTSVAFSVSAMTVVGTFFFSWPEVVIYAMVGIMASSTIDFYIAKKLGREYVRDYIKKKGGKLEKFDKVIERNTFKTIMILSAAFFVPPTIPNFLGGIIKIKYRDYFIATFLGNLPNTFFTIYLINGLFNSNTFQIYFSIIGLFAVTPIALYFYEGEIRDLLHLGFPRIFKDKK